MSFCRIASLRHHTLMLPPLHDAPSDSRREHSNRRFCGRWRKLENQSGSIASYERKVLPTELSRSVVTLKCELAEDGGVCDVYVVGTSHVSRVSPKEVQAVIGYLKPQVVFLELCSSRIDLCKPSQNFKPTFGQMVEMWKQNQNLYLILYSSLLAEMASKLGVVSCAEFHVAYDEAKKYGAKIILGDRPFENYIAEDIGQDASSAQGKIIILLAVSSSSPPMFPTFEQHGTLSHLLARFVPFVVANPEQVDDADLPTIEYWNSEMSKHFPTLMETIVLERDQYMSAMLLRIARKHNSVVAVMGKSHLPGIRKNWKKPVKVKELLSVPSKRNTVPVSKILISTIGATAAGVAVIAGLVFFRCNIALCAPPRKNREKSF